MREWTVLVEDEAARRREFPVTAERIFMAHAGVCPLPRAASDAIIRYAEEGSRNNQESAWATEQMAVARQNAATLLDARPEEIALLGPTALGLSLVAQGLRWEAGDEVVFYQDDYPANVYPWSTLEGRGIKPVRLKPPWPGAITWDVIEAVITPRTRLVALASCHFLSGYRIDIEAIGRELSKRGVLFCVDGIQSLGAFPLRVGHVDFLSADSHKWLLGPAAAGIFYVKKERQELLQPALIGAWNVVSPEFVAQEQTRFHPTARRYEPGILNYPGIAGMAASLGLLLEVGVEKIGARLLDLRRALLDGLRPLGYRLYTEDLDLDPATTDDCRSAIVTFRHPDRDMRNVFEMLARNNVIASYRKNREGTDFVRLSPHFYNTLNEIDRVIEVLR